MHAAAFQSATPPPDLARRLASPATATTPAADPLAGILAFIRAGVRDPAAPDLSQRQLGVFLTVYLAEDPHTVRGLAAELNVSKPAITRALDRLGDFDLTRRKVDPADRRSVLVQRTLKGASYIRTLHARAAGGA